MSWSDIANILALIFGVASWLLIVIYVPVFIFNALRLTRCKRSGLPEGPQDLWGWYPFGLLYRPSLLDDKGQEYQEKAMNAQKRALLGAVLGLIAFALLETI